MLSRLTESNYNEVKKLCTSWLVCWRVYEKNDFIIHLLDWFLTQSEFVLIGYMISDPGLVLHTGKPSNYTSQLSIVQSIFVVKTDTGSIPILYFHAYFWFCLPSHFYALPSPLIQHLSLGLKLILLLISLWDSVKYDSFVNCMRLSERHKLPRLV